MSDLAQRQECQAIATPQLKPSVAEVAEVAGERESAIDWSVRIIGPAEEHSGSAIRNARQFIIGDANLPSTVSLASVSRKTYVAIMQNFWG